MTESFTRRATRKQAAAARHRGVTDHHHRREAEALEREAAELSRVTHPVAVALGEAVPVPGCSPLPSGRALELADTLSAPTQVALDASAGRLDLLLRESGDITALAIDAADSIKAGNSLERMLAHQMALCHKAGFEMMATAGKFLGRAGSDLLTSDEKRLASVEASRLANAAGRMFQTYQQAMLTLQRIRTGGAQTVTVQHVHVSDGGQAVIGNLGGGTGSGSKNGQ